MAVKVQPPSAASGGGTLKGPFVGGTPYVADDAVSQRGRIWYRRAPGTPATFLPAEWIMGPRFQPARLVSTSRNAIVGGPNAGQNATTTDTGQNTRITQVARDEIGLAILRFANWYTGSSYDVPGPNVITVRCQIEVGSRVTPVTFNGGSFSVVITPGATIECDLCPIDVPAGTSYFVRTFVEPRDAAGALVASGRWPVYALCVSGQDSHSSSNGETDKSGLTGALANSTSVAMYQPIEILALDSPADKPSVLVVGDSIGTTPARGSFEDLALDAAALPFLNVSRLGDSMANWYQLGSTATDAKTLYRRHLLDAATHAICCLGRNDISGAWNLGQMQTGFRNVWALMRRHGCQWIGQTTITPKTTSTDSWATVANQTEETTEAVRLAVNAWLMSGPPEVDAVFDVDSAVTDPTQVGRWRAGLTGDGLHPNATGAAAGQAAIDTSKIKF
jgi:lysophospholipase L1-like esterase